MPMQFCMFPARVRASDGLVDVNRSAVVVIDGRAEVAVQRKDNHFDGGTVTVIAALDGVIVGTSDAGVVMLTGEGGVTWEVSQGDGCGCKSALGDWYAGRIRGIPLGT